ncbi:MAG: hypothetical protein IJF33_03175 [Clostridia bacterium]|nr:hypothetical protein [Clostridia bacterium]
MFDFLKRDASGEEKSGKLRFWLIVLGAAVGVALILWGGAQEQGETVEEAEPYSPNEDELVLYQGYLEERVKAICESVEGVSNVTAIVTLSGGFSSVYATQYPDGNEEYVIIGSGSNATALFLSRSAPEIAGIGIVCRGGSSSAIQKELTALIAASFHLPSNRIYVTEGG